MAKQYAGFSALLCYILIPEAALYGHLSDNGAFSDLFNIRVKQRFLLNKCSGSLLQKISVFKKDIPRFKHIAFKLCMGDGFVSGIHILRGIRKPFCGHINHSEAESCILRNTLSNVVESAVYIFILTVYRAFRQNSRAVRRGKGRRRGAENWASRGGRGRRKSAAKTRRKNRI